MSTFPFVTVDFSLPLEVAANVMIQNKVRHLLVTKDNDINKIIGIITPTDFVGYLKENLNIDNELNARLLEYLREPRGEDIVRELEQEGKLKKDSQTGGQGSKYRNNTIIIKSPRRLSNLVLYQKIYHSSLNVNFSSTRLYYTGNFEFDVE
jgi:hypothetical protein